MSIDFNTVISSHSGLINKVCYMYAEDSQHLQDLRQEVLTNIWEGLAGYKGDAKLSTWIYRVAINTCVSYIRRYSNKTDNCRLDAVSGVELSSAHSQGEMTTREMLTEMYAMIGHLGRLDKAVILLWLDGYSYDDIAALVGISKNNVAVRLHRAKSRLINSEI
ncbi:MAG: sigma-70 family RNA polymerase sigma factor [Muribaculaceae bacterium]|nr:sigma-70 family RNA polymerase sigma factor [Muribaculaceae bacterium]